MEGVKFKIFTTVMILREIQIFIDHYSFFSREKEFQFFKLLDFSQK